MKTLRPVHAVLLVMLLGSTILVADYALEGGFDRSEYQKVRPDREGQVVLDIGDLAANQVRFFHFINSGNQEVRFFVGRDSTQTLQVAFDANEVCYKLKRGYRADGDWVVCNKCDKSFRLAEVNAGGGGCKPVPLVHRVVGDELILREGDILAGWRYFN